MWCIAKSQFSYIHVHKSDIALNIGQQIKGIKDHNYILHSFNLDPVF